jgi:nucleotide-binding universal stress UspA family protein
LINKILVGIDDSKHAERTLKHARNLQAKYNCELHIFHSIEHKMIPKSITLPRVPFGPASVYRIPKLDYEGLREEYIKNGNQILKKAKKKLGKDDPKIKIELVTDMTPEDYAVTQSSDYDLILLGKKGDHEIFEKTFGTVTGKVMHDAECAVMVVK